MKKNILVNIILICAALPMLIGLTSCKRSNVTDPDSQKPSGFRITLKGLASPSTLYVPNTTSVVKSVITATLKDNTGKALPNKKILFSEGYYGYLKKNSTDTEDGYLISAEAVTNASGVATIYYEIPSGALVKNSGTAYIVARLIDDNDRTDNPSGEVYDTISVIVIPGFESGYELSGKVLSKDNKGIEGVVIQLKGGTGKISGSLITNSDGSYGFYVSKGWFGSITPDTNIYKLLPASYTFEETAPVMADYTNLNFYTSTEDELAVDNDTFTVKGMGETVSVNVYNAKSSTTIPFLVIPQVNWLESTPLEGETNTTIKITANPNTTSSTRTGTVLLQAAQSGILGSPVTLTFTQASGPNMIASPSTLTFAAGSAGESKSAIIKNTKTSDILYWKVDTTNSSNTTWITYGPGSGNTNSTITVTIQVDNTTGIERTGYIFIQAYDSNDNKLEGLYAILNIIQQAS